MKLKNNVVFEIGVILSSLGQKKHPLLAYRVAMLRESLKPNLTALQSVQETGKGVVKYRQEHEALCEKYATKDESGNVVKRPGGQPGTVNYEIVDTQAYLQERKVLDSKYADVLQAEQERLEQAAEVFDAEVELELEHTIKYSWCKELLSGNAISILLDCGILEMDEEPCEE